MLGAVYDFFFGISPSGVSHQFFLLDWGIAASAGRMLLQQGME